MKKVFILVLLAIASSQVMVAESYQRWVYWIPETHEVTAPEMAEITSLLYDNKVVANKEFNLSSGTRLKIPQPSLYLQYIEKAVRAANPAALDKDDIITSLNDSEKMRWGNDISGTYRNYYYSYVYKGVRFIDNFVGEGKEVDFLFINGVPAIKCDCGNPIENKNPKIMEKEEEEIVQQTTPSLPSEPVAVDRQRQPEPPSRSVIYRPYYSSSYRISQTQTEKVVKKRNDTGVTLAVIGGVTIVAGVGYFIYILFNNKNSSHRTGEPGGAPIGGNNTPTGVPGGTPTEGGPGGAPL